MRVSCELFSPRTTEDLPQFPTLPSWAPVLHALAEAKIAIYLTRQVASINSERRQEADRRCFIRTSNLDCFSTIHTETTTAVLETKMPESCKQILKKSNERQRPCRRS